MAIAATPQFEANLAALRSRQPDVAAFVESAVHPEDAEIVPGRDGTPALRLRDAAGRWVWLGQSSMPGVSAEALVSGVRPDGGSVILPGVLTGLEQLLLARRLPAYAAVFVLEPDVLALRLALHLHDVSHHVTAGRIVYITATDTEGGLAAFFRDHPGYDFPQRLISVPQRSAAQLAEIQRRLESAATQVALAAAERTRALTDRLTARAKRPLPPRPHVAVLSADARPACLEHARRIGRALEALAWPSAVCVPDAPDRCHIVARLEAVERVQADFVMLLHGWPARLRPLLPDHLPIISWFLPGLDMPGGAAEPLGRHDYAAASTPPQHAACLAMGSAASHVLRLDPAADIVMFAAEQRTSAAAPASESSILVLADLPDDRPEAHGVTLPSHRALWEAMRQALLADPDGFTPGRAEEYLRRAEHVSGTELHEPPVREQFLGRLREAVAPAVLARGDVTAAAEQGTTVRLLGANWSVTSPRVRHEGALPRAEQLAPLLHGATVLLPLASPWNLMRALDALAAGARVMLRLGDEPWAQAYPALAAVLKHVHLYASRAELRAALRTVTSAASAAANPCVESLRAALAGQTVQARLEAIRAALLHTGQ